MLADTGSVSDSCKVTGIPRRTAYNWRTADGPFRQEWDEAIDEYVDKLEKEADRRAVEGIERGVYYEGERVATETHYSDNLLMFRLKKFKPDEYRENRHITGDMEISIADAGFARANQRAREAAEKRKK